MPEQQTPEPTQVPEAVERSMADQIQDMLGLSAEPEPAPTEPEAPAEPVEPAEPNPEGEPTEPVEPSEPPAEPVEPVEPAEPVEPSQAEADDAMRIRMEELAGQLLERGTVKKEDSKKPKKDDEPTEPAEPKPAELVPDVNLDLTESEFDTAIQSREGFNDVVMKKVGTSVNRTVKLAVESLMRSIPNVVVNISKEILDWRLAGLDFYQANPELGNFKKLVTVQVNELAATNADKSPEDIFKLAGEEVRKTLKLTVVETPKQRSPAPQETPNSRRKPAPPELSGMAKEIADMNKVR